MSFCYDLFTFILNVRGQTFSDGSKNKSHKQYLENERQQK